MDGPTKPCQQQRPLGCLRQSSIVMPSHAGSGAGCSEKTQDVRCGRRMGNLVGAEGSLVLPRTDHLIVSCRSDAVSTRWPLLVASPPLSPASRQSPPKDQKRYCNWKVGRFPTGPFTIFHIVVGIPKQLASRLSRLRVRREHYHTLPHLALSTSLPSSPLRRV